MVADWRREYGDEVQAVETLVGPPRSGACFRHDGWRRVGYTRGTGARRPAGHGHTKRLRVEHGVKKMVLVRRAVA